MPLFAILIAPDFRPVHEPGDHLLLPQAHVLTQLKHVHVSVTNAVRRGFLIEPEGRPLTEANVEGAWIVTLEDLNHFLSEK